MIGGGASYSEQDNRWIYSKHIEETTMNSDDYLSSSYDYLEAELLNLLFITVTPKYKNSDGIPPEFFKENGTTLFTSEFCEVPTNIYKIIRKLYKEQRKSIITYILFLLCNIYIIRDRIDKKKNEERRINRKTSKQDIDEQKKHEDRTELIRQCILNIGDILKEESKYIPFDNYFLNELFKLNNINLQTKFLNVNTRDKINILNRLKNFRIIDYLNFTTDEQKKYLSNPDFLEFLRNEEKKEEKKKELSLQSNIDDSGFTPVKNKNTRSKKKAFGLIKKKKQKTKKKKQKRKNKR